MLMLTKQNPHNDISNMLMLVMFSVVLHLVQPINMLMLIFPRFDFSAIMRFSFTTSVTVCMLRPVCVTEVNLLKFIRDYLLSTVDALK